jgi:hypothetical protein
VAKEPLIVGVITILIKKIPAAGEERQWIYGKKHWQLSS